MAKDNGVLVTFTIIWGAFIVYRSCFSRNRRRDREAELERFREEQLRRRRRGRGGAAPGATGSGSGSGTDGGGPDPHARTDLVRASIFSRTLEGGDDEIRDLAEVLAAVREGDGGAIGGVGEEDKPEDGPEGPDGGGLVARTWRAAESSVRTAMGGGGAEPQGQPQLQAPECSICLDRYEAGDTVAFARVDGCEHIFHEECLVQWLADHDDCPLCRKKLVGVEGSVAVAVAAGDEEEGDVASI